MSTSTSHARPRTTTPALDDRWLILRHRLQVDGAGAVVLAAGFFLAVTALTLAVSGFTEVRISGWEAGTQLVRWFVGALGVYMTAVYLPLYVTHGRTRREVARQLAVFLPLYAVLAGVLVAAGFLLEGLVYGLADWPQALDATHLFDDPGQAHLVALEHALVFLVWVTGGAALGAAFYRRAAVGMLLIPLAVAAAVFTEYAVGPGYFGPLPPPLLELAGLDVDAFAPLAAAATAAACAGVLAAVTWLIVRDVPVRPQPTA